MLSFAPEQQDQVQEVIDSCGFPCIWLDNPPRLSFPLRADECDFMTLLESAGIDYVVL